jgi:elongation factor Ts
MSSRSSHTNRDANCCDEPNAIVSEADIPAAEYDAKKQELLASDSLKSKPAEMAEKIVEGQLKKHFAEQVLLSQMFILDDTVTVDERIKQQIAKSGENIIVRQFKRIELGVTE